MITQIKYDGFDAVEITTKEIKCVVVYEIGPRIAHFSKIGEENLLYWKKDDVVRGDWKIYGGHRVWLTRPYADESEDTYIPDNERCSLELSEDKVIVTAPANKTNLLERGMEIQVVGENQLLVRNFVKNTGGLIYSGGVWSPTCVVPDGKKLVVPLGEENSTWDIVKVIIPRVFAGNEATLQDDQVAFVGNDLVVTPNKKLTKRVCLAKQGKVILDCGSYVFEKFSKYNKLLKYPFEGCNVAVFNGDNNWMAELETFGGESEITPNETIDNVEIWTIK